ncbi:GGDEF domain-containing protein [Kiloniella laminariae]|uniref:diguanylate cyclase n=1 Tax=Kiloniella laminariae TaxID=454162 RepID=A0ABT4LII8_9PROT|nr:GGDEF domain-containing protein [Kiloniella laminariae]MCZ4280916.1 GGDEF domain-containing protein [Kiloniella laminariae]
MISHFLKLYLPSVFLLSAAVYLALYPQSYPAPVSLLLESAPVALPVFGASICFWLRKSNPVFAFSLVAIFAYFVDVLSATQTVAVYIILPLCWLVLALSEERGLLTPSGFTKAASLVVLALIIFSLDYPAGDLGIFANFWIDLHYVLHWRPGWGPGLALPALALATFSLATLLLTVRLTRKHRPLDAGYLGALIALFGSGLRQGDQGATAIFLILISLLLILALFQESHRMAFLDELTGIPGRRALLADMKKLGRRYSLAMVDVDFFKKFNDNYGHDVGDQVLRMIASRLSQTGGGSRAYRYGGEEFTLLFPGKDAKEAIDYLEEVRERIEKTAFVVRGQDRPNKKPKRTAGPSGNKRVKITVSIGLSERKDKQDEPEDIMKNADRALYKAKDKGRNCVIRN